jgi:hypothetical protein
LVCSNAAPKVEWPRLASERRSADAHLITGIVLSASCPHGSVDNGGSWGGSCGYHLDVLAVADEIGGSGCGCQGAIARSKGGPGIGFIFPARSVTTIVAPSFIGPLATLVHNFVGTYSLGYFVASLVASEGGIVVGGAASDHASRGESRSDGRCNSPCATTDQVPSQATARDVEWAKLSTKTRVWPCLALVHSLDEWSSGDGHTHSVILLVGVDVSGSPCSWASSTTSRNCRSIRGTSRRFLRR